MNKNRVFNSLTKELLLLQLINIVLRGENRNDLMALKETKARLITKPT